VPTFRIAHRAIELERETVEEELLGVQPEPVQEHYVVVGARRFPPKQVLSLVAGLDRADFTSHQARRILKRLGFAAARRSTGSVAEAGDPSLPHGGRQAAALAPFVGKWVALGEPDEVLVAADTVTEVYSWLARHERTSSGVFRVPSAESEAQGLAPL
jgi:hypothetical protein